MNAELKKEDERLPALVVRGPTEISIRAGTDFGALRFGIDVPVDPPDSGYSVGGDYFVVAAGGDTPRAALIADPWTAGPLDADILGGFHFAPGGNAAARQGGDDIPAINPFSTLDLAFRPACPDPRGMTLVTIPYRGRFWADIYLTGADHVDDGTSRFGRRIADGNDPPQKPQEAGSAATGKSKNGERFRKFDYETAAAVMAHHGKGLLSVEEFFAAAYGVTERTAHSGDPAETGLDAPRTSKWGLMQAAGNMWVWGHDGDPDVPRASIFGGGWRDDDDAGSRRAYVAYIWPDDSGGYLGARGRCDHLQPE